MERVADGPNFRGRVCKGDDEGAFENATVAVEIRGTNPEYGLRRLFRDLSERVNGVRCTEWQNLDLGYIEGEGASSDAIVGYLVSPHDGADDRAVPLRAVEGEALDFRSGNVNVERVCD